jgi:hypothetical protein
LSHSKRLAKWFEEDMVTVLARVEKCQETLGDCRNGAQRMTLNGRLALRRAGAISR